MILDVYSCTTCNKEFAVRDGEEPNVCTFCYSPEFIHTHEIKEYPEGE